MADVPLFADTWHLQQVCGIYCNLPVSYTHLDVYKRQDLKNGQKAVISELTVFDDMRRRLQDIGLIEGTVVECVGKSPLGDPAAYLIRGAVIALRSEDSGQVLVCRLNPQEETDGAGRAKAGSAKAHRDRAGKVRDGREREDKDLSLIHI